MIEDRPSAASAGASLVVENLRIEAFNRRGTATTIVRSVSFRLAEGEILGLLGESGSGKTMTCRAITGSLPPGVRVTAGRIDFGRKRPGAIFADPHASLDPLQKIGEQVAEVARVIRGLSRRKAQQEALRLFRAMSLRDPERTYHRYPSEVSGGMAQRAIIAGALASEPRFLVADEPTSALDATVQVEIAETLKQTAQRERMGILLTTHDIAVVARVCTTVAVMYAGQICEIGPVQEVLEHSRHPYTRLLLASRPRGRRGEHLATIRGDPLGPGDPRPPCPFAPRCPRAQNVCLEIEPQLIDVRGTNVACHFPHANGHG